MGTGARKPVFDGHYGVKHTGFPEPHVSNQSRTTPTLVDKDEQTDSEESVSISTKANMLDQPRNRFWKGYSRRSSEEVHPLHKRERAKYDRKGRTIPYSLPIKKQTNEKRGNNGYDNGEEKMQRDLSPIPSTPAIDIQACPFPAPTGVQT